MLHLIIINKTGGGGSGWYCPFCLKLRYVLLAYLWLNVPLHHDKQDGKGGWRWHCSFVSSFIRSFPHTLAASSFLPIFLVPLLERYPSFVPRFLLAAYKIHVSLMEFGMWKPTVISALRNHKKFIPSTPDLHHCTWNSNCLDQHCADDLAKNHQRTFSLPSENKLPGSQI